MPDSLPQPMASPRLVVTDLDGTLLDARHRLGAGDRDTLLCLGRRGVTRVVATGRSLYSACSVLDRDFPIDYLVFASGAGTIEWRTNTLLDERNLEPAAISRAIAVLLEMDCDFMIHAAVPENHRFVYRASGRANADFERRCERYDGFAQPWNGEDRLPFDSVSQLLAVETAQAAYRYEEVAARLADLTVIRATSPLDHQSIWVEIFAPEVSKDQASHRIAQRLGITPSQIMAVGNDYNDIALLDWAAQAYVVANAPAALRDCYTSVAGHNEEGFSDAVRRAFANTVD